MGIECKDYEQAVKVFFVTILEQVSALEKGRALYCTFVVIGLLDRLEFNYGIV